MRIVSRTFAVGVAAAALTLSALPPTQADEPDVTVRDRLGHIALVDEAVPMAKSPVAEIQGSRVTLGSSTVSSVSLQLPATGTQVTKSRGRYVLPATDHASLAVAPTSRC